MKKSHLPILPIALLFLASSAIARPSVPAAIVASAEPGLIAGARPLAMPPIAAWPGGLGMPRVITWADLTGASGLSWGPVASTTANQAFFTYNGTNQILNVPLTKGFLITVGGVTKLTVSNVGAVSPAGNIIMAAGNDIVFTTTNRIINATDTTTLLDPGSFSAKLPATLTGSANDGATSVSVAINAGVAMATVGAKILAIRNHATEAYAFKWDSGLTFSNTVTPAATDVGIGNDGASDMNFNVPTGKQYAWLVNGSSKATLSASGKFTAASDIVSGTGSVFQAASGDAYLAPVSGGAARLRGAVADGASAVENIIDTNAALSTGGAKILSIRNNGTENAFVDFAGAMVLSSSFNIMSSGGIAGGTSNFNVLQSGAMKVGGATNYLSIPDSTTDATVGKAGTQAWDFSGGVNIGNGNGTLIKRVFTVVQSITPGTVTHASGSVTAITGLSGLTAFTDICQCSPPSAPDVHLLMPACIVDAATTLSVRYINDSAAADLSAPSGNYTCIVHHF